MTLPADIAQKQTTAAAWFRQVRDDLCARLEAVEAEDTLQSHLPPGKFEITPWSRPEGGGGEIGLLHGRVFEKAGLTELSIRLFDEPMAGLKIVAEHVLPKFERA